MNQREEKKAQRNGVRVVVIRWEKRSTQRQNFIMNIWRPIFTGRNFWLNRNVFWFSFVIFKISKNSRKTVPQKVCSWVAWPLTHLRGQKQPKNLPLQRYLQPTQRKRCGCFQVFSAWDVPAPTGGKQSEPSTPAVFLQGWGSLTVSHAEHFAILSWTAVETQTEQISGFMSHHARCFLCFTNHALIQKVFCWKNPRVIEAENPLPSFLENEIPFFPKITQSKPHPLTALQGCNTTRCYIPKNMMKLLRMFQYLVQI